MLERQIDLVCTLCMGTGLFVPKVRRGQVTLLPALCPCASGKFIAAPARQTAR